MREFLNQFSPVVWPAIVNINIYTNQIYIQGNLKKPRNYRCFGQNVQKLCFVRILGVKKLNLI